MTPPVLTLKQIALTFGGTPLLEGADLTLYENDRVCLVGRNGSGKSTLMKIAAGIVTPDAGEIFIQPGMTWRYLPQEPDLTAFASIGEYVHDGLEGADDAYRIPYLLDALGLDASSGTQNLSGGEARRAALARTLAPLPDILLLDEPTNHLDLPAIEWLEEELKSTRSAIVLISHDRAFATALSRKTVWVDRGVTRELDKGFGAFEDWRDEQIELEEQEQHKLGRKIAREQHWIVHGVSGRRKRNMRRVKELAALRQQKKDYRRVQGSANVTVTSGEKSGKSVVKFDGVSKSFGERKIVDDLTLKINRGDRLGIIGPNGSGKTTLLKLMMGQLEPDSGTVELGTNLEPLVIDQSRQSLDPDWTLSDALTDGGGQQVIVGGEARHVMGYMKDYLFLPEQARTPISRLSGGERARLMLARGLRHASNFLVLDEPTNDLDLETLDLLQDMIADYKGTVIIVSHDRDFLDRTVTSSLAFDPENPGTWTEYAGGYEDLIAQRGYGVTPRKKSAQKSAEKETAPAPKSDLKVETGSNKLSYKYKHRLEKLPGEMDALRAQISKLETQMADPELYARDPEGFAKVSAQLEQLQSDLTEKEDEWLEIEMMREA